jgi:SAM-dependent methyltransferase
MATSCNFCEGTSSRSHFPEYGIVKCENCGLIFFPLRQLQAAPEELYRKEYFQGGEYSDYGSDKAIFQKNFTARVRELSSRGKGGKLLEIGCAYGFFLQLAGEHFQAKGIDISSDAAKYAKDTLGLNAEAGNFLDLPDEVAAYDVICMWDTIEHLAAPMDYLKKAAIWLKPGGSLILTTGDIHSLLARARGSKWRQIHPPTHLYYFDQKTITRALGTAGLKVVSIKYPGQYRSFRSMMYEIFSLRLPKFKIIYQVFTLGGKLDFPIYLNTFDIMEVTAER